MKFPKTLIVVLFFIPVLLWGQIKLSDDFKNTISSPYPVVNAQIKKYYSDGNGNIISIKKDDNTIIIQHFDDSNGKELSKKIYKDFPSKHELQEVIQIGSKLFYIYTAENRDNGLDIYTREIHFLDGTFDTSKLLFSSKGKVKKVNVTSDITDKSMIPYLKSSFSFDKSKVLLWYTRFPLVRRNSKNKDIYGFLVLDNSMQLIWGDEFTMPRTEAEMYNLSFCITKDGVVRVVSMLVPSLTYQLMSINSSKLLTENKIEIKSNAQFYDMTMNEDKNGDLIWVGYYGSRYEMLTGRDASFLIYMDGIKTVLFKTDGTVNNVKNYEFPASIVNQYEKNAELKKEGSAGIAALTLRESIFNEDGSILLVGEQFYCGSRTTMDPFAAKKIEVDRINHYNDVYVSLINEAGSVEWFKKLPKNQLSTERKGDNGIKFLYTNVASLIFYVEDEKNKEMKVDDEPVLHAGGGKGYFSVYKVDNSNGNVSKHFLFNLNDLQDEKLHQFDLSRVFEARSNLFFLEAYMKGDDDKLVRMELLNK